MKKINKRRGTANLFAGSVSPILSGILLALAFPKTNLFFLAWIGLVPFLIAIKKTPNFKTAAGLGYVLGITFFSINLAWVTTLADYAGGWAIFGFILLILFQAIYFAAAGLLIKAVFKHLSSVSTLLIPAVWIFIEWIRTLTPFGVAAGGLGYTQTQLLPLIQLAAHTSVYGISFFIVFVNAVITKALDNRVYICLILIPFGLIYFYGTKQLERRPAKVPKLKISIIQANIDQKKKLDPNYTYPAFVRYADLTRSAMTEEPDIIIWTETAITTYLMDNPTYLKRIQNLARENKAYLLVGTPYYDYQGPIYNSLIAFSPNGNLVGKYNKQHLVPFGEYLPFRPLLFPILKNLNFFDYDFSGDSLPSIINLGNLKIGVLICFESTFSSLSRERVKQGAQILLTVTNDAWFKDSSALQKHLNMGIMRAVENRKYFIQAANSGISAVIDPNGRVLHKTDINKAEVLTFQIPLPQ